MKIKLSAQLNCKGVEFSRWDVKRNVKIPSSLSPELAELVGIIMGDGNLYEYNTANKTIITFTGGNPNDLKYYKICVVPLIKKLFNIEPIFREYGNWFVARIFSRAIFTFFKTVIKIPSGKKAKIVSIPSIFLNSPQFLLFLIRGVADTDFSLSFKEKHKNRHYYPVINLGSASKILVQQLHKNLEKFGIISSVRYECKDYDKRTGKTYVKNYLYINGKVNLEKWMKYIGFSNPVHLTKYLIWRKFGFCPPKITLKDRKAILEEDVYPSSFMGP